MRINFDQKNDIMRIKFQNGKYHMSQELDNEIIIDMTKDRKIIGIEILDVSEKIPRKELIEITVGLSA